VRKIELEISGKQRTIALDKTDEGYTATIGDRTYEIRRMRMEEGFLILDVDGERYKVYVGENGGRYCVAVRDETYDVEKSSGAAQTGLVMEEEKKEGNTVTAPMPGKVIKINCEEGDSVTSGQTLAIVEAMKMENNINAHKDAVIKKVMVATGDQVNLAQPIIEFEEE
jgi:biotin carboxyl carrier protein